jgi:myo-inositol 2-dehydrogenase/D-chiro-inositol 1-dehydrogenase
MRVAVIGAGRVGRLHAELLARSGHQVLICDNDARASDHLASEVGGTPGTSAADTLKLVEAAIIATPPDTHAELVRTATDLGVAVLCEKPVAETAAHAEELAAYVCRRGGLVQVGFQRRFDPGYGALRGAIQTGDVGTLHLLRLVSTEPGLAPSPKTNIFRNTAIHDFDLVRWLSGEEIASISVEGSVRSGGDLDKGVDPDTIIATMRLSRGALAVVTVSRLSPAGYDARAEVLGSRDHLCSGMGPQTPVRFVDGFATRGALVLLLRSNGRCRRSSIACKAPRLVAPHWMTACKRSEWQRPRGSRWRQTGRCAWKVPPACSPDP